MMKRNFIQILFPALLVGAALFTGCADDALMDAPEVLEQQDEPQQDVWILRAKLGGEDTDSRLAYYKMLRSFMTTWEEGDQIVASSHPGNGQDYAYVFDLVDGEGTFTGTFQCDSFPRGKRPEETKSNAWTIYYPGSTIKCEQDYLDKTYLGQVQHGNDNFDHIEDYHFLRLYYGDKKSSVEFNMKDVDFSNDLVQQSFCMKLNLSGFQTPIIPVKIDLEYYDYLKAPSSIFYTHNYSSWWWGKNTRRMGGFTNRMSLTLEDFEATRSITAYMMMSNLSLEVKNGCAFRIYVTDTEGNRYYCEKPINRNATLEGGLVHQINCSGEWKKSTVDGLEDPENGIVVLQEATKGNGVDIVIMGDGFAEEHFLNGNYEKVMKDAADAFFSVQPYKALRDYFNVYLINAVSEDNHDAEPYGGSGATMGQANTKFSTVFKPGKTLVTGNTSLVRRYMEQAVRYKGGKGGTFLIDSDEVKRRASVALGMVQVNVHCYAGTCIVAWAGGSDYGNAYSVAYTALGEDRTGEQCRLTTMHEAAGHGFGKLADEYLGTTYSGMFKTSLWTDLRNTQSSGCYRNVNEYWTEEESANWSGLNWEYTTEDNVYWAELLRPEYDYTATEGLSMYKGGYTASNMFCRPTDNSLMKSQFEVNGQYFNAISRWAIWYRLMKLAGTTSASDFKSSLDEFIAFDKTIQGWGGDISSATSTTSPGNFVEQKYQPLAPPILKHVEWIDGRLEDME